MGIYRDLAPFYDAMNSEISYEEWSSAVDAALRRFHPAPVSCILDLGCGTGSMTIALAKRGYDLVGLDLSAEMLSVACSRAEAENVADRIQWTQQDMCGFSLCGQVEAVVSTLDCLNHLTTPQKLTDCFRSVADVLLPDGVFLFDLNAKRQFEEIYADEVYTMETGEAFCVWQNEYHPATKRCDFWITLFRAAPDGRYIRSDSHEVERYYPLTTVRKCLEAAGMILTGVAGHYDGRPYTEEDTRWYCLATRKETV